MIVLSIETSCDDTAISIIKAKSSKKLDYANFEVLSDLTASQLRSIGHTEEFFLLSQKENIREPLFPF